MSKKLSLRFQVLKRDNNTCVYCGSKPPNAVLEVDHVIPRSMGGTDNMENLVTSCFNCNRGKRDKLISASPTKPQGTGLESYFADLDKPESLESNFRNFPASSATSNTTSINSTYIAPRCWACGSPLHHTERKAGRCTRCINKE